MQLTKKTSQAVDIQNATLAGGVIVGASADLMLQVLITMILIPIVILHLPSLFSVLSMDGAIFGTPAWANRL